MRTTLRCVWVGALALALVLMPDPAMAQWYDDDEKPPGEGEILAPFTFKSFDLGSGGQLSSWVAPGEDIMGLTFLLRGGYAFDSLPIYIGLEVPMSYAGNGLDNDIGDPEFALGNVGLNFKARIDPDVILTSVFTGWSLDVYIPTFQGEEGGLVNPQTNTASLAHGTGLANTLLPGIHIEPEAISVVGTFDLVIPGHWVFFQFEMSAATYFPVTDTGPRKIEGALLWGGIVGVNFAKPIAFLVEAKIYTPLGSDDVNGAPAPNLFAISPGFRMQFGPFKPAVWVTFPLDEDYRRAWPDVIIGLDLGIWF